MTPDRTLSLYLNAAGRRELQAGGPSILKALRDAVQGVGWGVEIRPEVARHEMAAEPGYHIVVNHPVTGPRCLNLRDAYLPAFWRIEASNDRWDFSVAKAFYDPDMIDAKRGATFLRHTRPRVLGNGPITREGFIFMALQGQLTRHRHFQAMSPVKMIEATLQADLARPIFATLHPKENYAAADLAALAELQVRHARFRLSQARSEDLLVRCDYVVTQNSSMAFKGFFAEKPAVLFAQIDYHHIAGSVPKIGVAAAFRQVADPPDFGRYLFWFLQRQSIARYAGHAPAAIRLRLAALGWPVEPQ